MADDSNRRFYFINHEDDIPKPGKGLLIPYQSKRPKLLKPSWQYAGLLILPLLAIVFNASIGLFNSEVNGNHNLAATIQNRNDLAREENYQLNYGVQVALNQPSVFLETKEAFIDGKATFIEVDLSAMKLSLYENGEVAENMEILAKGERRTRWQIPSGLYQIESKKEKHFSSSAQIHLPWTLVFQGNLYIHGWPTDEAGISVPADFGGGGIRLANEDAQKLYEQVESGTLVLVHELEPEEKSFVYEARIPELKTPHYLIADVKSSTVLAASDLTAVAPIASVAKLMTAVVATEHISLDSYLYINEPSFVASLVPRLKNRSQVSMNNLLQLLLVESSNEAAEVIAGELGREDFIAMMNEKARSLGMLNTNFADPSGLSSDNTSSLSDLLRLTQYIYTNRGFIFDITANKKLSSTYVGNEFGQLLNFNRVEAMDNFVGGKVGETIAAGQTSITLHRLQVKDIERIVAIIILGSDDRNRDVRELLRYAEERFGT